MAIVADANVKKKKKEKVVYLFYINNCSWLRRYNNN